MGPEFGIEVAPADSYNLVGETKRNDVAPVILDAFEPGIPDGDTASVFLAQLQEARKSRTPLKIANSPRSSSPSASG